MNAHPNRECFIHLCQHGRAGWKFYEQVEIEYKRIGLRIAKRTNPNAHYRRFVDSVFVWTEGARIPANDVEVWP